MQETCELFPFRCYLFDDKANLITDPDFILASILDESKYKGVTMGKKEGEVMKDLIYKHSFFQRTESIDFQDVCSISPYAPKVCKYTESMSLRATSYGPTSNCTIKNILCAKIK